MVVKSSTFVARSGANVCLPDVPDAQPDTFQLAGNFPGNVFRPEQRLRTGNEYQAVFSASRYRCSDSGWQLIVRPNMLGFSRLGLAVSRKVSKRAVVRNCIKRCTRETFRTLPWRHDLGLDIVVVARPTLSTLNTSERRETLSTLFKKVYTRFADTLQSDRDDPTRCNK
jgi:ribonuclease P protein component